MPQILIDYIKQHGLEALNNNLAINIKRHGKYHNLVLLKYNQIESDMSNPVVQLCRGIILDEADDWKVVCRTFDKFFNHGDSHAAKIDFSTTKIFEKVDGSLMQLFYYDNQWMVASSGMPDAAGQVNDFGFSFAELFWKTWGELGYSLPANTNHCYSFELMSKFNIVVVPHDKSRIVLHGGRDLTTMKELNPIVEAHNNGWECVRTFPFDSFEAVVEVARSMDGTKQEGFVLCDSQYRRVKLKCENYVSLAHLRDSCTASKRQMIEIIRKNESSEFLVYFPQFTDMFYEIKIAYERVLGQIEGFYEAIKDIEVRKDFAAQATKSKYSGLLFAIKYGKIDSFKQGLAEMQIKNLEEWLGVKPTE